MIEINNVSKTFHIKNKKFEALKNVSLKIEKGDIYGVIGYSGAGKSTLIRLINSIEKPDSGTVKIEGTDINLLDEKSLRNLRKKIGMIFQNFNLLNSANIYENIAAPLKNQKNLSKDQIEKKVDSLLKLVDLEDKKYVYPNQLSGGQKQRVAIARALSNYPSILLCDEATSALDPNTTKSILDLLKKIKNEFDITVVLITHQMDVVKYICNKVSVMDNGEIVEQGNLIDVFINSKTSIAKEFISQSLHQDGVSEKQRELKKDFYKLNFIGDNADDPFIAGLFTKFGVTTSILFASIEKLCETTYGTLIVTIDGNDNDVLQAIDYLQNNNVIVEVLKYDK